MGILMEKKNMFIDDSSGLTPTEVRSRARRIARDNGGISMIMIDYLQLMRFPAIRTTVPWKSQKFRALLRLWRKN